MAKKFISRAIRHPGALTAQAKKVGETPMTFARQHQHDSGTTGRRARLAITLSHMRKKK